MSAELAAVTGLGLTAFMTLKIAEKLKNADNMIDEAISLLSFMYVIGLLFAGHGLSSSNSLGNSETSYLAGLLVAVTVFAGLFVQLLISWRNENREEGLQGFSLSNRG